MAITLVKRTKTSLPKKDRIRPPLLKSPQVPPAPVPVRTRFLFSKLPSVIKLLDYWASLKLKKLPGEQTKSYQYLITSINRLKRGTFFTEKPEYQDYVNTKFTIEQMEEAIQNFAVSTNDSDYYPVNKSYLKSCTFSQFLYNPYNTYHKSYFIHYLNNEPVKRVHDENEQLTEYLIGIYKTRSMNGTVVNISGRNKDCFILGSSKLKDFFVKNKHKVSTGVYFNDLKIASWLYEAILADVKDPYIIKPGYFSSRLTFEVRLPLYLNKQGILH